MNIHELNVFCSENYQLLFYAGSSEVVKDEATPTDHVPPPPDQEVQIDESLFDVPEASVEEGMSSEDVAVDESLFDIDNLQDLDLNDPSILQAPS